MVQFSLRTGMFGPEITMFFGSGVVCVCVSLCMSECASVGVFGVRFLGYFRYQLVRWRQYKGEKAKNRYMCEIGRASCRERV